MTELNKSIDPYLNTAHWDGKPTLIRVNELIVAMNGLKPKGKSILKFRLGGVGKLATES